MKLRPYQQQLGIDIQAAYSQGKRSVCAVLGCGGGKSVIAGTIAALTTARGNRVLFLVHRQELCAQIAETFELCGVDMGLCKIGMVQTITRHISDEPTPQLIITDECHHALAASYRKIYDAFPDAWRLGFTATPIRMGSGGLGDVFDELIESVSTRWLIDNGYLADYRYYSVKLADTSGLHVRRGDYVASEVAALMEHGTIYGDTVSNYKRLADGKQAIVYCASVEASKRTAEEFGDMGYTAAHLDGTSPRHHRQETMQQFRQRKITVLCNAMLFIEGVDVPDCEVVILLRPTKSLTIHIQQSMRSMRYKDSKTAIIIDHVGNVFQHGLPDDVREWSLASKKRKQQNEILVRECPLCFAVMPASKRECIECGHVFEVQERKDRQTVGAELGEVTREDILKAKPYKHYQTIKTFEEMAEFQKAKKYKFGWALHKCRELGIDIPPKYKYMMRYLR